MSKPFAMANDNRLVSTNEVVYRLQLKLLEGIKGEEQLFAAGALLSRRDYQDVVTERTITNLCGYPPCSNSLNPDRDRKRRFLILGSDIKFSDLDDVYCSSTCLFQSKSFYWSFGKTRRPVENAAKLEGFLKSFEELSLEGKGSRRIRDLWISNLKIEEKSDGGGGEVPFEDWIGPSDAIEGYIPQKKYQDSVALSPKSQKEGSEVAKTNGKENILFNDLDFMSTVIMQDEYNISKTSSDMAGTSSISDLPKQKGKGPKESLKSQSSVAKEGGDSSTKSRKLKPQRSKTVRKSELTVQDLPNSRQTSSDVSIAADGEKSQAKKVVTLSESIPKPNLKPSGTKKSGPKPNLKPSGAKKSGRSVTWADEKVDDNGWKNLCQFKEIESTESDCKIPSVDSDGALHTSLESAEACAVALSHAAEAVASGETSVADAISEAGIIILPHPHDLEDGNAMEDANILVEENAPLEHPTKPGISRSEHFDMDNTWYDAAPDGLSLTLSPFATMWMALFAWVTSSSLAYIYGRDESSHEDYSEVNGREYPHKIVLSDGRSNEIKQSVAACLSRAFPGLVSELRMGTPLSTLEQRTACLLDTMSFVDAIPGFKLKQWQVIALLFIEALSVSRLPGLVSYMTNRRMVLHKVLDGAHITAEEYETMKDLLMPLGRAPDFSPQSGA